MRAKFINEAKINPNKDLFNQFKEIFVNVATSGTWDPFYDMNQQFNPLGIALVDFDEHMAVIPPEEKREFQKANMVPEAGIRLLGFDPSTNKVTLYVDKTFDDKVVKMSRGRLDSLLNRLWSGFGHETIHLQQVEKMKVKQNPTFKSKEDYFGNKQEIMAMAFSFVQEMSEFHTKEDILNMLKDASYEPGPPKRMPPPPPRGMMPPPEMMRPPMFRGRMLRRPPDHPLLKTYKELGGKAYKLFLKYTIQYLDELTEGVAEQVFKPKSPEEMMKVIEQEGGILKFIHEGVSDPVTGGVFDKDAISLRGDNLIFNFYKDDGSDLQLTTYIKFRVNIKTGEYDYEASGYSEINSDFFYMNADGWQLQTTLYTDPKGFVSDLEDKLLEITEDEEINVRDDFKSNFPDNENDED